MINITIFDFGPLVKKSSCPLQKIKFILDYIKKVEDHMSKLNNPEIQFFVGMQFEVLCVTKRYEYKEDDRRKVHYHIPITGTAIIEIECSQPDRDNSSFTPMIVVNFEGEKYPLKLVRSGLDGDAMVLVIKKHDPPFEVWELYTTTLFPGRESVSIRDLRKHAALEIEIGAII